MLLFELSGEALDLVTPIIAGIVDPENIVVASPRKIVHLRRSPPQARWASETRLEISTDEVDYIMMGLAGEIRAIFRGESRHVSDASAGAQDAAVDVKDVSPRTEVYRK